MRGTLTRRTWAHDPALYAPASYRKACSYESFTPVPISSFAGSIGSDVTGVVYDAEAAIRQLNAYAQPALAPLARLLLRTESIASSRVEGMQVDARDLAKAEIRAEGGGKPGSTTAEILGNVDAMELAVESAARSDHVSVGDLVAIHQVLLARAPNSAIAGRIRDEQNWIGGNSYNPCGAAFVPPPPDRVDALLADVCTAVGEEHLPPLVQAALVHAQFESIHPFIDGNGRTGRALIQVVLRKRALAPAYVPPISVALAADKDGYIAGLVAFREDRIDDWLTIFAVAARRAADLAVGYLRAVQALQETWRGMLAATVAPRSDAAAWALIDVLPAYPVIALPVATAAIGRSKPSTNEGLSQLEASGVLTRLGGGERNRIWEADGLLSLIVSLEAGLRPPSRDRSDVR
jgi:Fic family protein